MIQHRTPAVGAWQILRPLAVFGLVAAVLPSASWGFLEIARGELLLETTARVTKDSNIFADNRELDDTIFSVEPALVYMRRYGRMNVDLRGGVTINRFDTFDEEDSNDKFARVDVTFPTAPTSPLEGSFYFDYFNGRRVDLFLNNRIDVDSFSAGAQGTYQYSPLTGIRFGVYYDVSYPERLADNSSRAGTIGFSYRIRPKASVFADFRYRRAKSEFLASSGGGIRNTDRAVFLGLTGDITPLITGTISAGYQDINSSGAVSSSAGNQIVANVSVDWHARPNTTVFVHANSDTSLTNDVRTVKKYGGEIGANQKFSRTISGQARVGWDKYDFQETPGRSDTITQFGLGLNYDPNKYFRLGAEATFMDRGSDLALAEYDRSTVSLFGTFKY